MPLGQVRLTSGKIIHGFAVEGSVDADQVHSNTFEMEWPRGSGRRQTFPEVDRAAWFSLPDARLKFEIDENGNFTKGVIAGSASVQQLFGIVHQASEFGADFETLLNSALDEAADLDRDEMGKCRSLSAAIDFDAIPAFVF